MKNLYNWKSFINNLSFIGTGYFIGVFNCYLVKNSDWTGWSYMSFIGLVCLALIMSEKR